MKKVIDYPLFITTVILTFFGIYMILSSTFYINIFDESNNPLLTFLSALNEVGLGMVVMISAMFFNARIVKKLSPVIMLVSIAALILTLAIGTRLGGSTRWLNIMGVSFATTEFAKLASILYFAKILSNLSKSEKAYKESWVNVLLFGGISAVLILIQPDLSSTFIYCSIIGVMLLVSGVKLKHLIALVIVGALLLFVAIYSADYRVDRMNISETENTVLVGDAAQVNQSLLSIAEGGLFGVGAGQAYQTKNAHSQAESDFIFSNVVATTGLLGAVFLISLYMIFIWRCISIALLAQTMYACLVATGVGAMVGFQALMHMMVTTKLIPPTGMVLPFVSSGGSSVLVLLASVGLVLKLSSNPRGLEN